MTDESDARAIEWCLHEIGRLETELRDCHGLLETAVYAMSTNGIQCGLSQAWLDEAIRVVGWDDEDEEAGGDP